MCLPLLVTEPSQAQTPVRQISGTGCVRAAERPNNAQAVEEAKAQAVINALAKVAVIERPSGRVKIIRINPLDVSALLAGGHVQGLDVTDQRVSDGKLCLTIRAEVPRSSIPVLLDTFGSYRTEIERKAHEAEVFVTPHSRPAPAPREESPRIAEDWYLAVYGGINFPQNFSSVQTTGSLSGLSLSDAALQTSAIFGGKFGAFRSKQTWLGAEAEFFVTNPHAKQQAVTLAGIPLGTNPGSHVLMLTSAFNVIARYPGERLQPYAGIGVALVNATVSNSLLTSTDLAPGLNLLAGIRVFLSERVALFGEFKYTRVNLSFDNALAPGVGEKGLYSTTAIVAGLSFHF